MSSQRTNLDDVLYLIKYNPTLCPPVPPSEIDIAIRMQHRGHDELHSCVSCGNRANAALTAETDLGERWVDLCWSCYTLVLAGNRHPARMYGASSR
jgi:hypothetical protein